MSTEPTSLLRLALPPLPKFDLPEIPPITDSELERQVFTHSSFYARPRKATSLDLDDGEKIMDNEKLEHVGDALLGAVVTTLLHHLYPNLKHGPATILKSHLVSNSTLSQLSHQYNLPDRLVAAKSELYNLRRGEKTTANIFESYVAGLFYSYLKPSKTRIPTPPRASRKNGSDNDPPSSNSPSSRSITHGEALDHFEAWLYPLFTPLAEWVLTQLRLEQSRLDALTAEKGGDSNLDEQAVGAMARLNEHCIFKEGGKPDYIASREGSEMWSVLVVVTLKDGSRLSEEWKRSTKKAASTVAAWKICQILKI